MLALVIPFANIYFDCTVMPSKNPQINVRVTEPLKELLHRKADENGRSVNSEIVARLEQSLLDEKSNQHRLTAADAIKIVDEAKTAGWQRVYNTIVSEIGRRAKMGEREFYVDLKGYEQALEREDNDTVQFIINPALEKLREAGFRAKIEDEAILISF